MRRVKDALLDLRFSDALTFLSVRRHGSLSAAAREMGVTASQVSKAIHRLEKQLSAKLLERTAQGVVPSADGLRIAPLLEEALARLRDAGRPPAESSPIVTLAGPSYVVGTIGGMVARALPNLRVRVLQLAPAVVRASANAGTFDVAFVVGEPFRLESWSVHLVGDLQRMLFATPAVAARLGPEPVDPERVKQERFVMPVNQLDGKSALLEDGCPLPPSERLAGHEAMTLSIALDLAMASGQVVYGPVPAALGRVLAGHLVPVTVQGWSTTEPLSLVVNQDRVTAATRTALLNETRRFVREMRLDAVPMLPKPPTKTVG